MAGNLTGGQAVTISNYPRQEVKAFGERVNAAMYDASIRHSMGGLGGCRDFRIEDFDEDVRPYILAYLEGDLDSVAITYAAMRTKELEPAQAAQAEVTDGIRPEDFTVDVVVKSMGGFAQINTQGVRVTHKPTGISVTCDVARSQHANRNQAFETLRAILSQQPDNAACKSVQKRLEAQQSATGEPVQTTPNFTQLMQILDGLNRCHSRDSKVEFLRSWVRDWTQHKVDKLTHPAPSVPATGEPVAWLDEMLADTREVFDAGGSETPQVVRDVIEYVASWVTVYREKNHPAPSVPAAWTKDLFRVVHAMELNKWHWKSSASDDLKRAAHEAATRLYTASKIAAPSVPDDVVRDAERCRFILAAADDMTTSRYKSLCELLGVVITEDFDLGAAIDAAMLATK